MNLPKELEPLRNRKIWLCYPLIWNDKKHNGVGGYDKPPINPYTLKNGSSDDPKSLATFDEAAAQIGKTAYIYSKNYTGSVEVAGVGIAFSGTGIIGLDLDNAADRERRIMTEEAGLIVTTLNAYTEFSPSGTGLHVIALGSLPDNMDNRVAQDKPDIFKTKKGEYQLYDSGYMTISGEVVRLLTTSKLEDRTAEFAEVYEKYIRKVTPIQTLSTQRPAVSPVVSSSTGGFTYERWLEEVRRLSDAEILERIFASSTVGLSVATLYNGDISAYGNDHSRADQALCTYLYGFTNDRAITERLFRSSALYRSTGKSRNYLERTLDKAQKNCRPLIGRIEFTAEEKYLYAVKKQKEELNDTAKRRYNLWKKERAKRDRRKI